MDRIAVYYRVSTKKQETKIQEAAFKAWYDSLAVKPLVTIYRDRKSGKDNLRPNFRRMVQEAHKGRHDMIVVYALDRFSRNSSAALQTILALSDSGVSFHSLTQPILNMESNTPFRKVLLAAFAELAQMEREAIVSRVRNGMIAARARGAKLGKPTKLTRSMHMDILRRRAAGDGIRSIAEHYGVGHSLVQRALSNSIDHVQYA